MVTKMLHDATFHCHRQLFVHKLHSSKQIRTNLLQNQFEGRSPKIFSPVEFIPAKEPIRVKFFQKQRNTRPSNVARCSRNQSIKIPRHLRIPHFPLCGAQSIKISSISIRYKTESNSLYQYGCVIRVELFSCIRWRKINEKIAARTYLYFLSNLIRFSRSQRGSRSLPYADRGASFARSPILIVG